METGSVVVHRGGKEKKYDIYIEDYVLSYLKRETDSLELSEIFFYGFQKESGGKIFVYGAGRGKEIPAFGEYELLEKLMCRLTQAGPVFMVREKNEIYEVKGYQVFYTNNEAMQHYLLEWQEGNGLVEEAADRQMALLPSFREKPEKPPHSAIPLQLGVILVALVAIVISSTNSYEKLEQLGQSAKEVFFAVENQEAQADIGASDREGQRETEIVIQRDTMAGKKAEKETEKETEKEMEKETEKETEKEAQIKEEGASSPASEETKTEEASADKPTEPEAEEKEAEEKKKEKETEQEQAAVEPGGEDNTEALSRSVTRYYEVEQGDTLYTISQKIYGDISRVEKICELNEIADPDKIRSGQKIILP